MLKGSKFDTIMAEPALIIIYPKIGPKVPCIIKCAGFFKATSPMKDINPNIKAGCIIISFIIPKIFSNIFTPFLFIVSQIIYSFQ